MNVTINEHTVVFVDFDWGREASDLDENHPGREIAGSFFIIST
jgi:hypothetical protein